MKIIDQIISLVKTKDHIKPKCVKTVYRGGTKQSQKKFKSIRSLFKLKRKNEAFKDRIIRDIRTLFRQEDHY